MTTTEKSAEVLLAERFGLDPQTVGAAAIARALDARMAALGLHDRDDYLRRLARSDDEMVGDTAPDVYLRVIEPSDRASHLIPDDPGLWTVQRYNQFAERRERALASMLRDLLFDLGIG